MSYEVVIFTPGLDESFIWGEHIVARACQIALESERDDIRVRILGLADRSEIAHSRVDLLLSMFTGPKQPYRVDDIADDVSGVSILWVNNRGDLLEEFSGLPFDGFVTNGLPAVEVLGRHQPAAWLPFAAPADFTPRPRDPRYVATVAYLGSGGRGNKNPRTTEHYLSPAKPFGLRIWGSWWDADYWAPIYPGDPERNDWHRYWQGPLPIGDIPALYSSAQIVLGYHEDTQREWGMWNNRVFEALACGALLISDRAAGLEEQFGEGIVMTDGGTETGELIERYLHDEPERKRRAAIGRRIAAEFTYQRWARGLLAFAAQLGGARSEHRSRVA